MASARKYANLPDLDNAPDVYETPDLADDVSTIQATTATSPTASSYDDAVENVTDDRSGVDRSKFQPNEARNRFRPYRVDARDVDFSDRAAGARRAYRTSSRKHRRIHSDEGDAEYGDSSDQEDEDLDRRIARLRQEVEEVKMEMEQKKPTLAEQPPEGDEQGSAMDIAKISDALDAVYADRHGGPRGAEASLSNLLAKYNRSKPTVVPQPKPAKDARPEPSDSHPDPQLAQALLKAAEFDTRLTHLEKALGLDDTTLPDQSATAPKPLLPTLTALDQKLHTLSNTTSSIDAAHAKTRQLLKDADRLHRLRASGGSDSGADGATAAAGADADRTAKLNALYGALPTIDALAPTLPLVLERLRTLRQLHGAAAGASAALDDLDARRREQAAEIALWREALDGVERSLDAGRAALEGNVQSVGEWVRGLEGRVARLR